MSDLFEQLKFTEKYFDEIQICFTCKLISVGINKVLEKNWDDLFIEKLEYLAIKLLKKKNKCGKSQLSIKIFFDIFDPYLIDSNEKKIRCDYKINTPSYLRNLFSMLYEMEYIDRFDNTKVYNNNLNI